MAHGLSGLSPGTPYCHFVCFCAPTLIDFCFPNRRGVMEITAVTLPVAAFLLRARAGWRHITTNKCSDLVQRFQFFVFCIGILPLVLFDCFMILSRLMPHGDPNATHDELLVLGSAFAAYLVLMAIAMYPGRTIPIPDDWDDLIARDKLHPRRIEQEDRFS